MPRIEDLTLGIEKVAVLFFTNKQCEGTKYYDFFSDRDGKAYWREHDQDSEPLPCGSHSIISVRRFLAWHGSTLGGLLERGRQVLINQDGTIEAHSTLE